MISYIEYVINIARSYNIILYYLRNVIGNATGNIIILKHTSTND